MAKKAGKPSPKAKFNFKWWLFKSSLKLLILVFIVNFFVQVQRKPTEILSLLAFLQYKTPVETWNSYGSTFREVENQNLPATFYAALAQLESSGNPWVSPPWKVAPGKDIFKLYIPQTTAVGLFQFTDDTFKSALQICNSGDCRKNTLFESRLSAQTSIHVAAAHLNSELESLYDRYPRLKFTSPENKMKTAAIVHLCGKGRAVDFIRAGYSVTAVGHCGAHTAATYVNRLLSLNSSFIAVADRNAQRTASR